MDQGIFDDFTLGIGQCAYDNTFNPGAPNEWGLANR